MDKCFTIPDGLVKLEIFPSGNCIYDAFNYATDICFPVQQLRQIVHDYVKKHYDKFRDVLLSHENFFENLMKDYVWDSVEGHIVWVSLSEIFKYNIIIIDTFIHNVMNIGDFDDFNRKIIYVEFIKNHYNCYVEKESYQFKKEMLEEQYKDLIAIRNMENDESVKLAQKIEFEESEKLAQKLQEDENKKNILHQTTNNVENNSSVTIKQDEIFYYDIENAKIKEIYLFDNIEVSDEIENKRILINIAYNQLNEELNDIKRMMKTFNGKMATLEILKIETNELKEKVNKKIEDVAYKYVKLEEHRDKIFKNINLC